MMPFSEPIARYLSSCDQERQVAATGILTVARIGCFRSGLHSIRLPSSEAVARSP